MLLKKNIDYIFRKDFYKLSKVFKKYGYLQILGSYNKDDIKYITDIDIQFIINNKGKKTFEDYYNCLVYILSNCDILFKSKDINLVFEAVKTIQEKKYNPMTNSSSINNNNNTLDFDRKIYSIKELLDNKAILRQVYDNFGIVKINMFLNYNNGEYFVPIDLIIIRQFTLSKDKKNLRTCVLTKDNIKKKNYLKSLKQIKICMFILRELGYINIDDNLFDDNKYPNKAKVNLTKKKSTSTSTSTSNNNEVSKSKKVVKKLNKKKEKIYNKGEVKKISSALEDKIVKMYNDLNKITLNNYYLYSIFTYINNIKKIINLPLVIFNRLYNSRNIYKLQNFLKKLISILLKKRELLNINRSNRTILERIYDMKINMNNFFQELESIFKVLGKVESNFQNLFKDKAITYYKLYLKLSNYFMDNKKKLQ